MWTCGRNLGSASSSMTTIRWSSAARLYHLRILQRLNRRANVGHSIGAGFTLDRQCAGVAHALKRVHESRRIDLPGAKRNFSAPVDGWLIRQRRVFHVHVADVSAEDVDR